ncbi:MAG TPA: bifunctional (p)ppGpp synthetase/guanosine-3',5'-bis(diphosphate) 3'-pyrophosphohydrolase [Arenicellales bacterium]|nr:bifunctional (p)ppGpp synthetase/guanosine-3',5'-bis(diphosphate) 3'-pyrophosphohydrolase [Arenicellales bacterium]
MKAAILRRKTLNGARRLANRTPGRTAGALCDSLSVYLDEKAIEEIYRAYLFGAEAHQGQRRSSGEPYIHHPIAVAGILAELKLDSRSIIAAILHDVIEDTGVAKQTLADEFGEDVALLVDGVSKIGQLEFDSKEHAEAENFRKMLMAMSEDIRVILIKLADRLHNMRTLDALPPEKRRSIARQTLDIYAPIANRLGLHEWNRELEDLSFQHLHPKRYRAIAKGLKRRDGNRSATIEKLRLAIAEELAQSGLEARVMGRKKNVYSIYRKMIEKRKSFSELYDIYGFRIIVNSLDDCYRALGIVHNLYKPIPGRFNDYIAIPKSNGYQSLHTTVFGAFGESVEIQIRTEDMHRIAEAGIAAHWIYKSDDKSGVRQQQLARQWLLDLLDTQKETGSAREFLEHLKIDLFPDEVYVFTPKGDIKKLPRGATALDFAYAVHTDVGHQCTGARINRELVSLPTVLSNGDHVEILTARNAHPNAAWLNYTVTSKARASIRAYLKKQRRKEAVNLGKRLLNRAIKDRRYGRKRLTSEEKQKLLDELNLASWDDLLADIGLGKRLAAIVAKQLRPPKRGVSEEEDQAGERDGSEPLAIHGAEGMLISYARCCSPIPNDPIVGFFTSGKGVVIHTANCPNIAEMRKQPDRWLHVQWSEKVKGEFPVNLRVEVKNQRGVLGEVATQIAEQQSNINNVQVEERDGRTSTMKFNISVRNRLQLANIMRGIHNLPKVMKVVRSKG